MRHDARARAEGRAGGRALCSGCILTRAPGCARGQQEYPGRLRARLCVCDKERARVSVRERPRVWVARVSRPTSLRIDQCAQRIASVAVTAHGQ